MVCLVTNSHAAPKVVVGIRPIHSLVSGIMLGVDKPQLLIRGNQSPHTYSLRPSDVQTLQAADVVIWVGPTLESALTKPIAVHATQARTLQLLALNNLRTYPQRRGGNWEGHSHGTSLDAHIWLDINNARIIVHNVSQLLMNLDPVNANTYAANRLKVLSKLDQLEQQLHNLLAPVKSAPFLVFHDGYQYFEKYFDLTGVGAIATDPSLPIGAKRLVVLSDLVTRRDVKCIFSEVQFSPDMVEKLANLLGVRVGTLDPLDSPINIPDEDAYFEMMRNLAQTFVDCLS